MPENPALSALASSAFSLPELRAGQLSGMAALVNGHDVLAVMPTGYGKSAIYQVAAVHLHRQTGHPAVVVSPLIALQEDQIAGLTGALGEGAAVAINSAHTARFSPLIRPSVSSPAAFDLDLLAPSGG